MARLPLSASVLLLAIGAAAAADPLPVHYWAGQTRIDTAIELDRIAAVGKAHERTLTAVPDAADLAALGRAKPAGAATTFAVLRGGTAQDPLLLTRSLVVGLHAGADADALAAAHGCVVVRKVDGLPGWVVLAPKGGDLLAALNAANAIQESGAARFASPLIERQHSRRGDPTDPLYANQWHLENNGVQVAGAVAGNDINVSPLWNFGTGANLGTGINVAVVDDGMERTHEDLSANARLDLGLNFNGAPGGANDPSPGASDFHGTWCSGLIAARDSNGVGGVGVAPRAALIGVRLIAAATTEADDASALSYQSGESDPTKHVHVSSNSWGPPDDVVSDPNLVQATLGATRLAALQTGTSSGRGGKGTVYVWAAGNGRGAGDNLSYDGLASSRYVIAVGASTATGAQSSYSESGPALLVNAGGGSGAGGGIVTTDRTGATSEVGNYTAVSAGISGTSFSTPVVSGVVALMLEANPSLTWRDVKHVLVRTATKNDSGNGLWLTNGAGREHNVGHGFGRVNAQAAVAAAARGTWVGVPAAVTPLTKSESVTVAIPDNNATGISRTRTFVAVSDVPVGFRTEYVELTVSATHTYRGDLRFQLTAPSGMISDFSRRIPDAGNNLSSWVFTSAAHWGEDPTGTWTLTVTDNEPVDTGSLTSWSVTVHGYVPHVAPTFTAVTPPRIGEDGPDATVTVTGSGFLDGVTRVRWAGTDLLTTWVNSGQLTAVVPASLLVTPGAVSVTAVNPDFDGGAAHVAAASGTVTVDQKPSITPPGPLVIAEDTPSSAQPITVGDDFTAVGSLVLTASSSNQAVVANAGLALGGSGANRTIVVTPQPDAVGAAVVTVTVNDGYGSNSATFTVNVTAANDPPVAFDGTFEARANQAFAGTLSGFDPDAGATLGAVEITDPADGDVTVNANGSFTFIPTPGFTGLTSFTWQMSDGTATSNIATATIVVMADPSQPRPRITSEPSVEVVLQGGGTWTYSPSVSHTSATTLSVTAPATVVGGTQISWPIAAPASGNHVSFVIVARDTVTGALDYQQIVLRFVPTGAPN